jgi:hypothetical protein
LISILAICGAAAIDPSTERENPSCENTLERTQTMTYSLIRLTLVALVLSTGAHARTLEVGENKEFKVPSAAAASAQDGDRVEIQPGEYIDCAIWSANKLVVEGIGDPDKVVVTDVALYLMGSSSICVLLAWANGQHACPQ